jgi:gliding motility-associated protein GldM
MAGGKQTPRQRMINILYLVLLGLIALNVPDNLLDAFKKITDSLDTSSGNVTKDVNDNFTAFENSTLKDQHDRAKPIYDTAKMAQAAAENLSSHVQSWRALLIKEGGGINPDINDVNARDNLDISDRLMIQDKRADSLKDLIIATRDRLISLLRPKDRQNIDLSLNTEDPPAGVGRQQKSWEEAYFGEGVPLGATLTNLAKIETDAKNAENEVVKKILSEAQKAQVNLDKFAAVATAPTSYVLVGQAYTADVFLTAYDSKLNPTITVGNSPISVDAGKGHYAGDTRSPGPHTWSATVSFKDNDGKIQTYYTPQETYMVAVPSAVISPDKMNVLYIGLPNPISVSAPGVADKDIHVSISSGNITGSNGHFEANVTTIGTATISVSGLVGGKMANLKSLPFRVKRIPDPKAEFAGKAGGSTSAANIRAQDRIFAILENFEFDAKFKVTRFTLLIAKPRQDAITMSANGNELTPQMKSVMNSVSPGTTVVFKDIIAVGPDGSQRGLDGIVFSAN